jgi:tetratricopeptide (TPR) repeat protein
MRSDLMEELEKNPIQEPDKETSGNSKKKQKKLKKERYTWWQSLLILILTLGISVGSGYYISDKYFWSDFDENRLNEQLAYYKDKVNVEPNNSNHRVNLGYSYFLKGENDEAIKQLKVALDLDKNNFDAYLNLGIVYKDEERLDDALKMALKATKISPRDYKGHLLTGSVYRKLKMAKESLDALNEANKLMPGNTDIIYEIGRLIEDEGDAKGAAEIYKEALNYDPLYKPALEGLERVAANDKNNE